MYSIDIGDSKDVKVDLKGSEYLVNGLPIDADIEKISDTRYIIHYKNKCHTVEILGINKDKKTIDLVINNKQLNVKLRDKLDALLEKLGMDKQAGATITDLKAPMPGLIINIMVTENQQVRKGDPLIVLEAMKMENTIKASGDGVVNSILVKEKQSVEKNEVLMRF